MFKYLFYIQGLYFFVTGIWPIISITTFQLVSGPKHDLWLVKTVGALIAALAVGFITAGARDSSAPEMIVAAIGCSFVFICVDLIYII